MPMKIDHVTLGRVLSQSCWKCLKLATAASAAYPQQDPFVRALFAQTHAFELLKSELDTTYHTEVCDAEFKRIGHPYYRLQDPGLVEPKIGVAHYRPRTRNRKRRFSNEEILAARRCLVEIGESLEYARRLISEYGSQHRVNVVLNHATISCEAAGFLVGVSPVSAVIFA
ncbi:hypothetical protein EBB79_14880 [Parasedimentitalea marina]|uniref:Uncharacterized protein n=1 Tax=Parasedimentitalea marina TaxID=2483033 RepID=A0A3T0N4S4_9RHOB|nr:hypothetical protein [Parasedimentitalea marina]AZV79026.1 hypothetical protein EBB79_14880 [Parasedimentitalea marina]